MKVSFIIPVYKVEKYINVCIESIINQTYRDIEVILVDDGSPDNCPKICDGYAIKDTRIKVIHKENGGLSDARNTGLKLAKGDYVIFVDGDDFWVDNNQLEALIKIAQQQPESDFIGYNCNYYYSDTKRYLSWVAYSDLLSKPIDKNVAMVELVKSGTLPMSACLKLIKRNFLIKNNLFFVKGQIAEDIPWFINLLDKCNKCCFVNLYIYAYRQNVQGSITNLGGEKSFRNLFEIVKTETEKVDSRSFNKEAKDALRSFIAYELCILLTYPNITNDVYKELKSYSWIFDFDINPKVKIVKRIKNLAGLPLTMRLLKFYNNMRKNKK